MPTPHQKRNSLLFDGYNAPASGNSPGLEGPVWHLDIFYVAHLNVLVLHFFGLVAGVLIKFGAICFDNINFLHLVQWDSLVLPNSVRLSVYGFPVCQRNVARLRWFWGGFFWMFLFTGVKFIFWVYTIALVAYWNQHLDKFVIIFDDLWGNAWNLVFRSTKLWQLIVYIYLLYFIVFVYKY